MYSCYSILLVLFMHNFAQNYKTWFFDQNKFMSDSVVVGITNRSFNKDTSAIKYDTSSIEIVKKQFIFLDTLKTGNILAIIAAQGTHVHDHSLKNTLLPEAERPQWVDKIPDETNYH